MSRELHHRIVEALASPTLSPALHRFSEAFVDSRAALFADVDFPALKSRIVASKDHAARHLEELVAEFSANARGRGAVVTVVQSAAEACDYVRALAERRQARRVIKSKSMATEEIGLNAHLEAAGLTVTETDLGEWILQLGHDRPSHMIMPAIHRTKEEVRDLFAAEVETQLDSDIAGLVAVARRELRDRFLEADMGVSGANLLVAETGSAVVVSNEGNARLVSTLPRLHVIVAGLEKLVATMADVAPILSALPKSATAQRMTSYVSVVTGPTPNPDGSLKELHVVLLAQARAALARDPVCRQAWRCIRCAACLNVCPVFRLVGGHVFGRTYTGGIGTILTAFFESVDAARDLAQLCIQCGRCREVCPADVDIPALILELRRRQAGRRKPSVAERTLLSVVSHRSAFHGLLRTASLAQRPLERGGFIRHLPLFLSPLTAARSLPAIAREPLRDRFPHLSQPPSPRKVVLFAGCLLDFVYPEMGEAIVRILNHAGLEVLLPPGQTCCGLPALQSGATDAALANARDNLDALADADTVITACPTCVLGLTEDLKSLLARHGEPELLARAVRLGARTREFASFALELVRDGRLQLRPEKPETTVTYHDSCHLKRRLRAHEAPRELLRACGFDLIEMPEADVCCGMGGSYALKLPELSDRMLARKLQNVSRTGAGLVAADCPGCVLQLRGGLDRQRSPIRARHTLELLLDRLAPTAGLGNAKSSLAPGGSPAV